jgi:hypothetical protein
MIATLSPIINAKEKVCVFFLWLHPHNKSISGSKEMPVERPIIKMASTLYPKGIIRKENNMRVKPAWPCGPII